MSAFVICKLLSAAKTRGTDVDAVACLADGVCTFYADGMREVAGAAIALYLEAWLAHSYYVIRCKVREKAERGG